MSKIAMRARAVKLILLAGLWFSALPTNAATVSVDCDAGNTICRGIPGRTNATR